MEQILYLLAFITATVISMALIPLMVRIAPRLGMIDEPDPRKVHTVPVPRAGGVGIVIGSLLPIVLWSQGEQWISAFIIGAVVLLVFGVWDDMRELGHYAKFLGQIIAALLVVYYGDIYIMQLPFLNLEGAEETVAKPFTVFAIVGMINALNTSDGLDGLAGGLSLLSLSCIAYLGFMANGNSIVMVSIAALGGVFGFLRYNTHPARVFMGDGGSQFLGFTLGVLAVVLTQRTNTALSPVLPLLFLGLPIVDIVAVIVQRVRRGTKWYLAHKDHIHHRLLQLKFHHYEAVVLIYSVQMLFIASAIFLGYESDALIFSFYFTVCFLVFMFLTIAERRNWRAHSEHGHSKFAALVQSAKQHAFFTNGSVRVVAFVIPFVFIAASILAPYVPRDFGISAGVLVIILLLVLILRPGESIISRAISYVTAAFVVYLETKYIGGISGVIYVIDVGLYVLLALSVWLAVRYASDSGFRVSPMDFLVIFVVLTIGIVSRNHAHQELLGLMAIKLVILFYGCELIHARYNYKWNLLDITALVTLSILCTRSLL
jgi:UDP-GlcNAc:undecaprenyl-phosphate/decaprenyl-phosphate GlcNAc-1-phosphate transferase